MKYTYTAIFTKKNGKVYARVPDLDGCITTGKNLPDAIDQITDAMSAWLCTAEDEKLPIPPASEQSQLQHNPDEEISLVKADTLKYRAMTDTKSVRKNVSLPHWLLEFAEKHNINCSQVLQDALLAKV